MSGDNLNHYMSKTAITRAIVEGTPGRALCGDTFVPKSQGSNSIPGSEVADRNLKICPKCERIYDGLEAGEEAKDEHPGQEDPSDLIDREFERLIRSLAREVSC